MFRETTMPKLKMCIRDRKIGLNAKFDEREGYAHEWRFWELEIQEILKYFGFKKGFKESLERAKVNDHTLV